MLKVWFLLLIVNAVSSFESGISNKRTDSVLCRNCGRYVLSSDSIISKVSPASVLSYNDTIFNDDKILVQVLSKGIFFQFSVITSKQSSCVGLGEWEDDDTWFPGYKWKTCVCSGCGEFVGWIFEPIDNFAVLNPQQFYALIFGPLIGERFVETLIIYPDNLN